MEGLSLGLVGHFLALSIAFPGGEQPLLTSANAVARTSKRRDNVVVMQLLKLDHVNVRTANLDRMVDWYRDVLGMEAGERPPFSFPGAWLYVGEQAVVHLVGVDIEFGAAERQLEHFALSAIGLPALLARLDQAGVVYETTRVPGLGILQVNLHDCDGNHIHVDFPAGEADAANL